VTNGANVTFNTGSLQNLQLSTTVGSPVATTEVGINVNTDANSTSFDVSGGATPNLIYDHTAGAIPFDRTDPTTFHHVTATTVYDSLGAEHVAQMYFRKVDETGTGATKDSWQVITYVDGVERPPAANGVAGGAAVAAPPTTGQAVLLKFNTDGTMRHVSYDGASLGPDAVPATPANFKIGFSPIGGLGSGAADVELEIDFRDITQFGSEFAVNDLTQNGFSTGRLTGFDVEDNGVVFARFTNGNAETLGMVAIANVANPQGLQPSGDSLWAETNAAGDTVLGQPGTASLGLVQAGALEASTTELSDELVNMIVSQRNYQANAQVISTADQLTQTLLNIR
jgi:flagellar hook protein FlgE